MMECFNPSAPSGLFTLLFGVVMFGVGMWGYRYWLKRDPESLERWASELKRLKARGE